MKVRVSLKYKLLIVLFALPIIALSFYILLAKNVFEQDKVAYVYNTGISTARNISNQLSSELQLLFFTNKQVISGYDSTNQKMDKWAEVTLSQLDNLKFYEVYQSVDGEPEKYFTYKSTKLKDHFAEKLERKNRLALQAMGQREILLTITDLENKLMTLFIRDTSNANGIITATTFSSDNLMSSFVDENTLFKNYLVDSNGQVLLGFQKVWDTKLNNVGDFNFFKTIISTDISFGTSEEKHDQFSNLLVSYAKIPIGDFVIVSIMEKKEAFKAVDLLISKSLIFFISIISLSILISIITSNRLTRTLTSLVKATEKISEGNFSVDVNVKSTDEIGQLAGSFNIMTNKISNLLLELQKYNEQLEKMVEERTKELKEALALQKAMVDSLSQGFFMFNHEGIVLDVYSKASKQMFNKVPSGEFIGNLLQVPEGEVDEFKDFCGSLVEEPIPFNDLILMAPQQITNENNRTLFIDYQPVRNEKKKVTNVVVVVTDKTDELEAQRKAEVERAYVQMITKILINKNQFLNYLRESNKMLGEVSLLLNSSSSTKDTIDCLYRYMHTLKGNSALFHIFEMEQYVHGVEDQLRQFQKNPDLDPTEFFDGFDEVLTRIESIFDKFIQDNGKIFGLKSWNNFEKEISMPYKKVEDFYYLLNHESIPPQVREIFVKDIYSVPIRNYLSHYNDVVQDVAQKLNKQVEPVSIIGGDIRIIDGPYNNLFSSLIHAFRNSIDHGLEDSSTRAQRGKPAKGRIKVKVSEPEEETLRIQIVDDGNGIDPAKIRSKVEKDTGMTTEGESDEEIIQRIFDSGLSTKDQASTLSGRGIGMDAIKIEVEKLGGSVRAISLVGEGTEVVITVPFITNI